MQIVVYNQVATTQQDNYLTSTEKEFYHLQMTLVAGQSEGTLLELIGVSVDVGSMV